MSGFLQLVLICIVMGAGTFAIGMAPIFFDLSASKIRMISCLGAGILVGTSLVVVIPEGANTLYEITGDVLRSAASAVVTGSEEEQKQQDQPQASGGTADGWSADACGHTIGIMLLLGFVLMFLIEKLPSVLNRARHSKLSSGIDMSSLRFSSPSVDNMSEQASQSHHHLPSHNGGVGDMDGLGDTDMSIANSTSIGLVIHSIADGIALGASSSAEIPALQFIIFLAILIHKAPASFGFTSILLSDNLSSKQIKRHLGAFAAAAPIGALITYGIIKLIASSDKALIQWWTGALLVFSGGTFMYVAIHVMSEIAHDSSLNDVLLTLAGMFVPLVTFLVPDVD